MTYLNYYAILNHNQIKDKDGAKDGDTWTGSFNRTYSHGNQSHAESQRKRPTWDKDPQIMFDNNKLQRERGDQLYRTSVEYEPGFVYWMNYAEASLEIYRREEMQNEQN